MSELGAIGGDRDDGPNSDPRAPDGIEPIDDLRREPPMAGQADVEADPGLDPAIALPPERLDGEDDGSSDVAFETDPSIVGARSSATVEPGPQPVDHAPAPPRSTNRPQPRLPTACPSRTTARPRTNTLRTAPSTAMPSNGVKSLV